MSIMPENLSKPSAQIHRVSDMQEGVRLDRLCQKIWNMPNTLCQKYCRKGLIRVNEKRVKANDRVMQGDVILCKIPFEGEKEPRPIGRAQAHLTSTQQQKLEAMLLYKDAHILVLNKPSGLAVQGGSGLTNHLDGMLHGLQFNAPHPPKLVHRLDKDTSGLLILARNDKAARSLQAYFAEREMHKTYLAVVMGVPEPRKGSIESHMEKQADASGHEKMRATEDGKWAKTDYETLDYMAKTASLMALSPITGRTHQLRVHMAEMGHPILGERKYAARADFQSLQLPANIPLHLHSWQLALPAMLGEGPRQFTAPIPPHMQQTLQKFGLEARKPI